eukprot:jgi/Galph1/2116/GphlegSOOS_G784.1
MLKELLPDTASQVGTVSTVNENMDKVTLQHAQSKQEIEIFLFGATVTSWKKNNVEKFFLSQQADFSGNKAIRGGIPICFPQFGPYGNLVQHGFARVSSWKLKQMGKVVDNAASSAIFVLTLEDIPNFKDHWPHPFEASYQVTLGMEGLETTFRVRNTGTDSFSFTFAFHNYFLVSDVSSCPVYGLENKAYIDRLNNDMENLHGEENPAGFQVTQAVDRIYSSTPSELAIFDSNKLQILTVRKWNLPDTTLWNPFGASGSDPGWKNFLCLEPAAIKTPIHLSAGEEWTGSQVIFSD